MIALVGLGTLGVRVLAHLPRDSTVRLLDHDVVRDKNVPQQYPAQYIGWRKVHAAQSMYGPHSQAIAQHVDLLSTQLLDGASLVIDCTDSMHSRLVLNEYCRQQGIPLLHCAVSDTTGVVAYFAPSGPCLRCVYGATSGERCSPNLHLGIADATAQTAAREYQRHVATNESLSDDAATALMTRIEYRDGSVAHEQFVVSRDPRCPACAGAKEFLARTKPYYLTYCEQAQCMAAKPVRPAVQPHNREHEHEAPRSVVVQGVTCTVYPSGEIHFATEEDEDVLDGVAQSIFTARGSGRV